MKDSIMRISVANTQPCMLTVPSLMPTTDINNHLLSPTTWWGFASCWSLQLDGKAGLCMSLFVPSVENMGIIISSCWMNEWILQLVSFIFFMDFYFSFPNLFTYNSITKGHCLFVLFYHAYFLSTKIFFRLFLLLCLWIYYFLPSF